ncbi:MAG: glucose-1-phosphate adenylyltransferase subunit GlgD [Clostridia bacterium]|nr:glucose-1-phosphate adenylyltransferase subunit GlgD [Clostridia bacterium]
MNMAGIIFSNLFDENFGLLTKNRTVASLPFGGRYRLIDFVLSNMSNSTITNVGIVTKYNYNSLMDHLGSSAEWDLNRKNGGVYLLPPFSSGQTTVYQGKLEALYSAFSFLDKIDQDYVVLSDSTVICNIDYDDALESHIKSGADITVIANKVKADKQRNYSMITEMSKKKVTEILVDYPALKDGTLASMGMYIMEKQKLVAAIKESVSKGRHHLERDLIQREFNKGTLNVNVFEFKGKVIRNNSIATYFNNNLALISDEELRRDIFNPARPIYTKVRDEVPTFYASTSSVDECLVADGCRIKGNIENSVLFRDVKIEKNASVKNSIIMQGSVIGEGCEIEYAIIDKDAKISAGTILKGAKNAPLIVEKGETV